MKIDEEQTNGQVTMNYAVLAASHDRIYTERSRLLSLIDKTADHWMTLQMDHPIQWEGAIDGAMEAACSTIATQAATIKELTEALERIADEHTDRDGIECQQIATDALARVRGEA